MADEARPFREVEADNTGGTGGAAPGAARHPEGRHPAGPPASAGYPAGSGGAGHARPGYPLVGYGSPGHPVAGHPQGPRAPRYPPPGHPPPGWAVPPAREGFRPPVRVEPVEGTGFGVAYLEVPPATSGVAVGALVAGIASLAVALLVACFGFAGARAGWGAWVAGAFAVLAAVLGMGGTGLGVLARRQIRRRTARGAAAVSGYAGYGIALAGLLCGAAGLTVTIGAMAGALALQLA